MVRWPFLNRNDGAKGSWHGARPQPYLFHELAHELAPVAPRFCGFVLCCCVLSCVGGFAFWFWCLVFCLFCLVVTS